MARQQEIEIQTADRFNLAATTFEPEQGTDLNLSVQINNAMGLHQGFYQAFATFLADNGVFVVTYDYRGIGRSSRVPAKEDPARLRDWGEKDLAGVTAWLAQTRPDSKLMCVCHSLGAPLLGLAENANLFDAVVVIASGTGYWRNWDGWESLRLLYGWHLHIPFVARIYGYLPASYFGWDLPCPVAIDWAMWCRHPEGYPLTEGLARLRCPVLIYSFSDDTYSPPRAVNNLKIRFKSADVTHREIKPQDLGVESIGHFGFFKKTAPQSAWLDLLQWMKAAERQ